MPIPLQLRLTLFYAFLLGLALLFFGWIVYSQAEQRAYRDLDNALNSRVASVALGKILMCSPVIDPNLLPFTLPNVDGLGTGGIAIEVLDNQLHLLATTSGTPNNASSALPASLNFGPVPWDAQAAQAALRRYNPLSGDSTSLYSTIIYQNQRVRVYTQVSNTCNQVRVIQAARTEQDIEQSLGDLRALLLRGGALVLVLALLGGWLITWGVLRAVQRITRTAQSISHSRNFHQRVPLKHTPAGRDELTRLATAFNEMLANLEETHQRQQRFVADASHELRAPITSIRCNLDLLAGAPDLPASEVQAAVSDAQAEADRMGRLVNDLLTLARTDEAYQRGGKGNEQDTSQKFRDYKKDRDQQRPVDLDSLLLEVFRQYRPVRENVSAEGQAGKENGPRLILQHITPAKVYGDADQLKQTMVALLDNALKYTPYEGQVSLSLNVSKDYAIFKVSDTGTGILPEDLPHIFERFYRADRVRNRDRGGSGLGLAIVRGIVEEHSGSIQVESTPGKGSTFTIKLPLAGEA